MFNQKSITDFFNKSKQPIIPNQENTKLKSKSFFPITKKNKSTTTLSHTIQPKNITLFQNENNTQNSTVASIFDTKVSEIQNITIFTDGSTYNNGKRNAKGGVGVYFEDGICQNISEKFKGEIATNQKCELLAVLKGLDSIKKKVGRQSNKYNIIVYTDSEYVINCMTKWIRNWINNEWKRKKRNGAVAQVKNKSFLQSLWIRQKDFNTVIYNHVRSHQKEPYEKNSHKYRLWKGNDEADKLAKKCVFNR